MKISVALCTYNGELYVRQQLQSILSQTQQVDELIICDDGSTDGTVACIEQVLKDATIPYKIIQNESSLGVVCNFYKAYHLCSGDIIFSCDQDDVWQMNKVERIMPIFEDEKIQLVASNADIIDAKGNKTGQVLNQLVGFEPPMNQKEWKDILLHSFCITGATMALRKNFFVENEHVSKQWLHDGWLAILASFENGLYYLNEPLTLYRIHGHNTAGVGNFHPVTTGLTKPFYFSRYAKEKYELYKEVEVWLKQTQKGVPPTLLSCIDFWDSRSKIATYSFSNMRKRTKKMKQENLYIKYANTNAYYYLDYYFWLVYKIFKSKARKAMN
ncbi:hypothetical protein A4S06_08390 [Erysipelotrichaceae bacterium MTC7]|nr:hypothetical protein A4S06_08390 [Erysipelotrichaceae bacterium MTC7]